MRFDPRLYLKWIKPGAAGFNQGSFNIVNNCALVAKSADNLAVGFTVFEPRDLNDFFLSRLEARKQREEFLNCRFELYLPPFLKHRAEDLGVKSKSIETIFSPFLNVRFDGNRIAIRHKIRVVTVDDSPVLLKFLRHTMDQAGFFDIVEQVSNSSKAADVIRKLKPDMVTMDIQMPGKTGVEVVGEVLDRDYFPIIMISSVALDEGSMVFDALNLGAFDYIQKPAIEDKEAFRQGLVEKSLLAVSVRDSQKNKRVRDKTTAISEKKAASTAKFPENLIWCLGASTGGTQALTRVLTSLPNQVPPTLIVQHIPPIFSKAFADALDKLCPFTVKEASDGDVLQPNHVYIAPGGMQMGVERHLGQLKIAIRDVEPVNRFKPSVDYLFSDVSKQTQIKVVAGVLTGMGRDGANGLLGLKSVGAHTFVQDEETSTVFGMPRAAYEVGAAERIVPLDAIAETLLIQSSEFSKAS